MKSFALLVSSLAFVSACSSMKVADFEASITLPASGDCYGIKVLSKAESRLPRAACDEKKKRAVFIDSENYKLLKTTIQKNCQYAQCKQLTGAFDELFLSLDQALQKLP